MANGAGWEERTLATGKVGDEEMGDKLLEGPRVVLIRID